MRALCWFGKYDVRVVDAPEPKILNPRDAIIRVTSTAICGSSFVITHRLNLSDAPFGYETFKKQEDDCIKIVLQP